MAFGEFCKQNPTHRPNISPPSSMGVPPSGRKGVPEDRGTGKSSGGGTLCGFVMEEGSYTHHASHLVLLAHQVTSE